MGATRTIVISGGADGIGRATARAFAQLGDYVVVADNAPDRGERTVGEIIAEGGSAEFQFLDVRDKASVDQTIEQTLARRGSIDVAVANAGIVRRVPFHSIDESTWDDLMDVNLKGAFTMASL